MNDNKALLTLNSVPRKKIPAGNDYDYVCNWDIQRKWARYQRPPQPSNELKK